MNNEGVKMKKNEKKYSYLFFFRQVAELLSLLFKNVSEATFAGNLDPFYIFGIKSVPGVFKNKKLFKEVCLFFVPLILLAMLQLVLIKDLNIIKFIVNLLKILICILIMLYFKNKKNDINLFDFCKSVTIIESVFLILSLIFINDSILWRLNDYTNGYDLRRLRLLYLEPSELGFHISIIIILLLTLLIKNVKKGEKSNQRAILVCLAINALILYLSKSMGAIVILFIAIVIMLVANFFKSQSKKKSFIYLIGSFILVVGLAIFMNSNSGVAKRIQDVFDGHDNSVNYRVGVSVNVFKQSLKDYHYLGCGFGNVNTTSFISRYNYMKLVQMIVNSFIYFWTETGIIGLIYWVYLMYYIIKNFWKNRNITRLGLLSYVLVFQFVGSHFTSGIIWVIYGIAMSDKNSNEIEVKDEKNSNLHKLTC